MYSCFSPEKFLHFHTIAAESILIKVHCAEIFSLSNKGKREAVRNRQK